MTESTTNTVSPHSLAGLLSPAGRRGRLTVFCYHQVLEEKDLMRRSEPTLEEFKGDLRTIASLFTVLPLSDAVRRLKRNELPSRAAAITFDDGYLNNHDVAADALEEYGLPATFYIATGKIEMGVMWNDVVIEAIARCSRSRLEHDFEGCGHSLETMDERRSRVNEIIESLKYRELDERREIAESFYRANVEGALPVLMMTPDDIRDLARRGFDIGGHTVRHPILATLSEEDAVREIVQCRDWLEAVTGERPENFAYPNGVPGRDFTDRDASLVRDAGFKSAVSTEWAVATRKSDVFRIPRVGPWWRQGRKAAAGQLRGYLKSYVPR